MLKSFKHRGLEKFFTEDSKAGIQPDHAKKLRLQLTALNSAKKPTDMDAPGWKLHPLKGAFAGQWAISVNGNWRLIFAFDGEDAVLVDYMDYH